MCEQKEILKII